MVIITGKNMGRYGVQGNMFRSTLHQYKHPSCLCLAVSRSSGTNYNLKEARYSNLSYDLVVLMEDNSARLYIIVHVSPACFLPWDAIATKVQSLL